jgi:hypothetical protein
VARREAPAILKFFQSISVWDSPTFMTWASFLTRSLGMLALLPLVLVRFREQEIAVFLLFNVMIGLRSLADLGFSPTFVRYIAYCIAGAKSFHQVIDDQGSKAKTRPNLELLAQVVGAMRQFHRWGALATLLVFAGVGTIAASRQVRLLENPEEGWQAWVVIVITMGFAYWANQFSAYLQGLNEIASLRRWEAILNVLGTTAAALVLLLGGRLFGLVMAIQLWTIVSCMRNWVLARQAFHGWWKQAPHSGTREVMREIWPPAWRTGIGTAANMGLVQITGVLFAQFLHGLALAELLLALRLIAAIAEFSSAPFYSKLPFYSHLYSTGNRTELLRIAGRGMTLVYGAFLSTWIGMGIAGPWLFRTLHTKTPFPSTVLWALLGLAFLVHRFGAMHLQLYSTTNHIIMHVADGISGVIYIIGLGLLTSHFGVLAVPLSQLIAYLGFYCWYSAVHSYRLIGIGFFRFERLAALPAILCGLIYVGLVLTWPVH